MVTKLDKVPVVTIGVGWAGGIVAAELSKAGHKVVGLERGSNRVTEDFANKHDELRYINRHELMNKLSDLSFTFRNNTEETAAPLRHPDSAIVGRDVGGGGLHWAAQTHRYFPYDFEIRSKTIERYGEEKIPEGSTIQDWGITYDELEPYFDKFEKTMGTSGERNDNEAPRENDYPTPPLKKTPAMALYEEAVKNLGYSPYVIPCGTISEEYENPDGQTLNGCQYNGFCGSFACEWGARASPVTTVIPTALATDNFDLKTNSLVTRILHENGKATGVIYKDTRTLEEFEQPADLIVLTSYTLNNIRLLLLSEIGEPYNPETGEGIIGKNFTDHHAYHGATGFFDDKIIKYISTGVLGMAFGDYNADNFDHSDYDFIHGGQVEIREQGNMPISTNPVPNGTKTWGREFKDQSVYYANRHISLMSQKASLPYENNYADLDPTFKDPYGDPLLRITVDYHEEETNRNNFLIDKAEEILKEMGAHTINKDEQAEHFYPGMNGMHNGGGVIMGDSPDNSAVNNYMQMWDIENLFVCGASAFPHFGATNPTLTMGALTYRATEGMIKYLDGEKGMLVEAKTKTTLA